MCYFVVHCVALYCIDNLWWLKTLNILGILSLLIGGFLVMASQHSVRDIGIAGFIPLITGVPFILFWKMINDVYQQIKRDNTDRWTVSVYTERNHIIMTHKVIIMDHPNYLGYDAPRYNFTPQKGTVHVWYLTRFLHLFLHISLSLYCRSCRQSSQSLLQMSEVRWNLRYILIHSSVVLNNSPFEKNHSCKPVECQLCCFLSQWYIMNKHIQQFAYNNLISTKC